MKGNITFTIIKPCAVRNGNIGPILADINAAGFKIIGLKLKQLTNNEAAEFYGIHKERPFYGELVEYMVSGPVVVAVLEKENAVEDFRTLIGNTDPKKADAGTIRAKYAESISENAVHGSDSDDNAKIESSFFFPQSELYRGENNTCSLGA